MTIWAHLAKQIHFQNPCCFQGVSEPGAWLAGNIMVAPKDKLLTRVSLPGDMASVLYFTGNILCINIDMYVNICT